MSGSSSVGVHSLVRWTLRNEGKGGRGEELFGCKSLIIILLWKGIERVVLGRVKFEWILLYG